MHAFDYNLALAQQDKQRFEYCDWYDLDPFEPAANGLLRWQIITDEQLEAFEEERKAEMSFSPLESLIIWSPIIAMITILLLLVINHG